MAHLNIEAGVLRALTAYKAEGGASDQTAAAWATSHLTAGVAQFNSVLNLKKKRTIDDLPAEEEAFENLKTWATAQP
jgi:hypothetical protein